MPGWQNLRSLIELEWTQSREEGRAPSQLETLQQEYQKAGDDPEALTSLHRRILEVPVASDLGFIEPNDLETIRSLRSPAASARQQASQPDDIEDRMLGAWLGRCIGCALGKPVEVFMHGRGSLSSRMLQKRYLTAISAAEWPLKDYFPQHSPAEEETGPLCCPQSTREQIAFMETDDDIRYTVLGQIVLRAHGSRFTTWDVARAWMEHLGYARVCTAETQAYRNLVTRHDFHTSAPSTPPSAEEWHWVATHLNPYREWIGAQIRVDSYGYAAAGDPELAAEFAWRDARLSHVKNGIYGAMFCPPSGPAD